MVQTEAATIYRGGGRRWLTLRAACRAEARMRYRSRCRKMGDEWNPLDDYYGPRIERLARWYLRAARRA